MTAAESCTLMRGIFFRLPATRISIYNMQNPMPTNAPGPQAVSSTVTRSAIFIVATLTDGDGHADTVRAWCADVAAVVRAVGHRVPGGNLSCVCGFGSE